MTGMEQAIERAKTVIDVILRSDPQIAHGMRGDEPEMVARALASAGLLAPAPLREEWAARYTNGGGTVCRTRDEAETELARMNRDSRRPRIDEPPAPQTAGIYARHVTDWETT